LIERTASKTFDESVNRLAAAPIVLVKACNQKTSIKLSAKLVIERVHELNRRVGTKPLCAIRLTHLEIGMWHRKLQLKNALLIKRWVKKPMKGLNKPTNE
jgi:hypothetical protein